MSNKILIPYGKCLSLTPNLNGVEKIDKIYYDSRVYKKQIMPSITFSLIPYTYEYDEETLEIKNLIPVDDIASHEYISKIRELSGYNFDETLMDLRINVSEYVNVFEELDTAYLETTVTKYSRTKNSGDSFEITNDSFKTLIDPEWSITTVGVKGGYFGKSKNYTTNEMYIRIDENYGFNVFYSQRDSYRSSTETIESYCQYDVSVYLPTYSYNISENVINNSNGNKTYKIVDNNFMDTETKYSSLAITYYNANLIAKYYKKNRMTIDATLVIADYYDENGNLVVNKTNGEIIEVGNEIKFITNKNNLLNNKSFKVVSSEFDYNGVPKLKIKCKENFTNRAFVVNLINPQYMTVQYSYNNYWGRTSGTISQTTNFDDILEGNNITISAAPLPMTSQYIYEVDNPGGTYSDTVDNITITASQIPYISVNGSVSRGNYTTLVNNTLFAGYTGQIQVYGKISITLENGTVHWILGSLFSNGTVIKDYEPYFNGWLFRAYDDIYDEEEDYSLGFVDLLINSSGVSVSWETSGYNNIKISRIDITGVRIRKI